MFKVNNPKQERAIDSKTRILNVALELFANYGYDKTSTREIAEKANVNLGAIKYYFGDKESLYKSVYNSVLGDSAEHRQDYKECDSLNEQLERMFSVMLHSLQSKTLQLGKKLHMREQLDPKGLWNANIENDIKPKHIYMIELIKKEIPNISNADAHRLHFSMISLFLGIFVNQDVINSIDPSLITDETAISTWKTQLVKYAHTMVEIEKTKYKEIK